ncbi:hypothetical protein [Aliamphritea spongicola]|nr:hypothetical protein [Aliamphritea spongicola]
MEAGATAVPDDAVAVLETVVAGRVRPDERDAGAAPERLLKDVALRGGLERCRLPSASTFSTT